MQVDIAGPKCIMLPSLRYVRVSTLCTNGVEGFCCGAIRLFPGRNVSLLHPWEVS